VNWLLGLLGKERRQIIFSFSLRVILLFAFFKSISLSYKRNFHPKHQSEQIFCAFA